MYALQLECAMRDVGAERHCGLTFNIFSKLGKMGWLGVHVLIRTVNGLQPYCNNSTYLYPKFATRLPRLSCSYYLGQQLHGTQYIRSSSVSL